MNNAKLLLVLGLILAMAVGAEATTYYVNASGGLDSNDGLSAATAWKTWNYTWRQFATIKPGDVFLLAAGENWTNTDIFKWNKAGNSTHQMVGTITHKPITNTTITNQTAVNST